MPSTTRRSPEGASIEEQLHAVHLDVDAVGVRQAFHIRETVAHYVRQFSKPAEAPRSSLADASGRSDCEPLRIVIESKLDQGWHARRIYQDLVEEHGFAGSYWSVMRFVRSRELPFRCIERAAGEETQVAFGSGAVVVGHDGERRKTHVFCIVLSHSRKGYSETVFRQSTEGGRNPSTRNEKSNRSRP